jgi:hypothetical protein
MLSSYTECTGSMYVAIEQMTGKLGGKGGSFYVAHRGNDTNDGKLHAFGLRYIEDIGIPKANKGEVVLLGDVLLGVLVFLALDPDNRGEHANASPPFFTRRPSWFYAYIPATLMANGDCLAISKTFPKL